MEIGSNMNSDSKSDKSPPGGGEGGEACASLKTPAESCNSSGGNDSITMSTSPHHPPPPSPPLSASTSSVETIVVQQPEAVNDANVEHVVEDTSNANNDSNNSTETIVDNTKCESTTNENVVTFSSGSSPLTTTNDKDNSKEITVKSDDNELQHEDKTECKPLEVVPVTDPCKVAPTVSISSTAATSLTTDIVAPSTTSSTTKTITKLIVNNAGNIAGGSSGTVLNNNNGSTSSSMTLQKLINPQLITVLNPSGGPLTVVKTLCVTSSAVGCTTGGLTSSSPPQFTFTSPLSMSNNGSSTLANTTICNSNANNNKSTVATTITLLNSPVTVVKAFSLPQTNSNINAVADASAMNIVKNRADVLSNMDNVKQIKFDGNVGGQSGKDMTELCEKSQSLPLVVTATTATTNTSVTPSTETTTIIVPTEVMDSMPQSHKLLTASNFPQSNVLSTITCSVIGSSNSSAVVGETAKAIANSSGPSSSIINQQLHQPARNKLKILSNVIVSAAPNSSNQPQQKRFISKGNNNNVICGGSVSSGANSATAAASVATVNAKYLTTKTMNNTVKTVSMKLQQPTTVRSVGAIYHPSAATPGGTSVGGVNNAHKIKTLPASTSMNTTYLKATSVASISQQQQQQQQAIKTIHAASSQAAKMHGIAAPPTHRIQRTSAGLKTIPPQKPAAKMTNYTSSGAGTVITKPANYIGGKQAVPTANKMRQQHKLKNVDNNMMMGNSNKIKFSSHGMTATNNSSGAFGSAQKHHVTFNQALTAEILDTLGCSKKNIYSTNTASARNVSSSLVNKQQQQQQHYEIVPASNHYQQMCENNSSTKQQVQHVQQRRASTTTPSSDDHQQQQQSQSKSGLDYLSLICQYVLLDHNYNATLPPDSPPPSSPPSSSSANKIVSDTVNDDNSSNVNSCNDQEANGMSIIGSEAIRERVSNSGCGSNKIPGYHLASVNSMDHQRTFAPNASAKRRPPLGYGSVNYSGDGLGNISGINVRQSTTATPSMMNKRNRVHSRVPSLPLTSQQLQQQQQQQQHLYCRTGNSNNGIIAGGRKTSHDVALTSTGVVDDAASDISDISERKHDSDDEGEETDTAPEAEAVAHDDEEADDDDDDDNDNQADHYGDYVTRCICGFLHDDGYMVECDKCKVWQHVQCVVKNRQVPDEYLCEICDPNKLVDRNKARLLQQQWLRDRQLLRIGGNLPPAATAAGFSNEGLPQSTAGNTKPVRRKQTKVKSNFKGKKSSAHFLASSASLKAAAASDSDSSDNAMPPSGMSEHFQTSARAGNSSTGAKGGRGIRRKSDHKTVPSKRRNSKADSTNKNLPSPVGSQKRKRRERKLPNLKQQRKSKKLSFNNNNNSNNNADFVASNSNNMNINNNSDSQQHQQAALLLHQWIEKYEEAVTNHYSPELRARISNIRVNGSCGGAGALDWSPELLNKKNDGDDTIKKCRVHTQPLTEIKYLVSTMHLDAGTVVVELRGKYMLASQHDGGGGSANSASTSPSALTANNGTNRATTGPFVFFYRLNNKDNNNCTEVCVDTRTYGNCARFIRRSCRPNAELRHCIEKGVLHLYIVTISAVETNCELTLRHELHDLAAVGTTQIACACGGVATGNCTVNKGGSIINPNPVIGNKRRNGDYSCNSTTTSIDKKQQQQQQQQHQRKRRRGRRTTSTTNKNNNNDDDQDNDDENGGDTKSNDGKLQFNNQIKLEDEKKPIKLESIDHDIDMITSKVKQENNYDSTGGCDINDKKSVDLKSLKIKEEIKEEKKDYNEDEGDSNGGKLMKIEGSSSVLNSPTSTPISTRRSSSTYKERHDDSSCEASKKSDHKSNGKSSSQTSSAVSTSSAKKMSREERKLEAILRAIEQMEKADQRKQEHQAKQQSAAAAHRRESEPGPTRENYEDVPNTPQKSKSLQQQQQQQQQQRKRRKGRARTTSTNTSYSSGGGKRRNRINSTDSSSYLTTSGDESMMMLSPTETSRNVSSPLKDYQRSKPNETDKVANLLLALSNRGNSSSGTSNTTNNNALSLTSNLVEPSSGTGLKPKGLSQTTSTTQLSSACMLVQAAVEPLESAVGFKFPKKVLMNEWLLNKDEEMDDNAQHLGSALNNDYDMSFCSSTPSASSSPPIQSNTASVNNNLAALAQVASFCDNIQQQQQQQNQNDQSRGSAKKRWLRQAIGDQDHQQHDSVNYDPNNSRVVELQAVNANESSSASSSAPLKKRRLPRESCCTSPSNEAGGSTTIPATFNTATDTMPMHILSMNNTEEMEQDEFNKPSFCMTTTSNLNYGGEHEIENPEDSIAQRTTATVAPVPVPPLPPPPPPPSSKDNLFRNDVLQNCCLMDPRLAAREAANRTQQQRVFNSEHLVDTVQKTLTILGFEDRSQTQLSSQSTGYPQKQQKQSDRIATTTKRKLSITEYRQRKKLNSSEKVEDFECTDMTSTVEDNTSSCESLMTLTTSASVETTTATTTTATATSSAVDTSPSNINNSHSRHQVLTGTASNASSSASPSSSSPSSTSSLVSSDDEDHNTSSHLDNIHVKAPAFNCEPTELERQREIGNLRLKKAFGLPINDTVKIPALETILNCELEPKISKSSLRQSPTFPIPRGTYDVVVPMSSSPLLKTSDIINKINVHDSSSSLSPPSTIATTVQNISNDCLGGIKKTDVDINATPAEEEKVPELTELTEDSKSFISRRNDDEELKTSTTIEANRFYTPDDDEEPLKTTKIDKPYTLISDMDQNVDMATTEQLLNSSCDPAANTENDISISNDLIIPPPSESINYVPPFNNPIYPNTTFGAYSSIDDDTRYESRNPSPPPNLHNSSEAGAAFS